ncbi:MAG: DUF2798 domain-containing protein [Lactobacillaceae bacterium]|nr:DUF2798 domain-containing protein [Lactobacillaceae bacterium]
MFNQRNFHTLFVVTMSLIFTFIMSAILTFVFVGFSEHYFIEWMQDWAVAFVIAVVLNSFIPEMIQARIKGMSHPVIRYAAIAALINTIILSFALVSFALRGWSNPQFLEFWLLHAWPVAMVSAFLINLVLPKLVGRFVSEHLIKKEVVA